MIDDMLDNLIKKDEPEISQNIKGHINFKIYLNTLKNAYNAILDSGVEAKYAEKDMGDYVEVVVKIPKR